MCNATKFSNCVYSYSPNKTTGNALLIVSVFNHFCLNNLMPVFHELL
jgi:hypothetical protein